MTANLLTLNSSKIEFLLIGLEQHLSKIRSTAHHLLLLYGHFGPRTLRPQDTSAPIILVPKCPGHFGTGAEVSEDLRQTLRHWYRNVSRHFGKVRRANSRRIGLRRVQLQDRTCPAASPHYANCAACVGRRHKRYYVLSLVVSLVLSRLDYGNATLAGLPGNQLDRLQSVMNAAA